MRKLRAALAHSQIHDILTKIHVGKMQVSNKSKFIYKYMYTAQTKSSCVGYV